MTTVAPAMEAPVPSLRVRLPSRAARVEAGRGLRKRAGRRSHGRWAPAADRRDPIEVLDETNAGRVPDLVPIRMGRMARSPFAFLRGAAAVMAADLAGSPGTGMTSWICGDAHLSNFGLYASPERELVFDVNDFDETIRGPWEWDVKRLAASIVVAGRERGFGDGDVREAVRVCVGTYRGGIREISELKLLEAFQLRWQSIDPARIEDLTAASSRRGMEQLARKAQTRTNDQVLRKLTVQEHDGGWRFDEHPPLLVRLAGRERDAVVAGLEAYPASLESDRADLVRRYGVEDVAFKVVGVGSVGTRAYVAMLTGNGEDDALFLQIKEAPGSQLCAHLEPEHFDHEGRRVVEGQHSMQCLSDPFLGWTTIGDRDYYVRQLRDMKGSLDVERIDRPRALRDYGLLVGGTLAMAHSRSGDPAMLAGYMGSGDRFDRAIADFAVAYADQTERDHAALLAAIDSGRVDAELGV
jgi:uncharacterized protein (DUF2252 family)